MLFITRVIVGDHSRALVTRKGRFATILGPGEHTLFGFGIELERHDVNAAVFASAWNSYLLNERPALAGDLFHVVETGAAEVAMVFRDGQLERVQAPGERTLVWKTAARVVVEIVNVAEAPIAPRARTAALMKLGGRALTTLHHVEEGKAGLLFLDGKFRELLSPGAYGLWSVVAQAAIETVDLRVQALEIPGQEIMTSDKVSIRVNIWAEYQIVDPLKARQTLKSATDYLYKVMQLAVRQSLAKRTLDEVLSARTDIDASVAAEVRTQVAAYGFRVGAIAVKDIIPPGEVRDILNQVVAAEKKAQANLIERREETAATRSLLNTAKLMVEHPLLLRMKELETLERIAGKVEKIHVHGGFDGLLHKLVVVADEK